MLFILWGFFGFMAVVVLGFCEITKLSVLGKGEDLGGLGMRIYSICT